MVRLSEILGWRKKDKIHLLFNGRYSQVALETALTSCDREIDREALMDALSGTRMFTYEEFAERIISTMPTWLKRIEK